MLKVSKIILDNLKNIQHVEVVADQTVNYIAGNNGSGKTTLVESIFQAISMKEYQTDKNARKLIKKGEEQGKIVLELVDKSGEQIVVERTITPEGTNLRIQSPTQKLGASFIATWLGEFTIDPLAFSKMKPQEQIDVLKQIANLDTTEIDKKISDAYAKRTYLNRQELELRAIVEKWSDAEGVVQLMSVQELAEKKQSIMDHNDKIRKAKTNMSLATDAIKQHETRIEELLAEIEKRKNSIKDANTVIEQSKATAELEPIDTADVDMQLANIEEHNKKAYAYQAHVNKVKEHEDAKLQRDGMDELVDNLRKEKIQMFIDAGLPIENLSFDEEGYMLIGGIPFNQLSTAEQIKLSTQLATHDRPELRVLYIQDGSLLDDKMLQIIVDICKERDYQLFIEIVGERSDIPSAVIMRDGAVV